MGGNLAQEILFLTPEIISKLVLIDCARNSGNLTPSEKLSLKLSKPILRWYPWKALIGQSADACGNSKHVKEYVKECLSMMRKQDFIKVMESTFSCLREDPHYRFPKPALLICGEDDRSGNIRKTAAPWAAADANVVLSMIQNAGHNSNQDNPDDVNKAICEFLSLDPSDIKKL
jgi:pimeloyl-ACP methyl ester carboxylesterase